MYIFNNMYIISILSLINCISKIYVIFIPIMDRKSVELKIYDKYNWHETCLLINLKSSYKFYFKCQY